MRYLFDDYALDCDRRELRRGAEVVPLAPQVFDLLAYLIRNRERVVSKHDIIGAIWNGRVVSDAALTTRLNAVRSAVGDSGEQQHLIRTLPRRGFRFVGQVREVPGPTVVSVADDPKRSMPVLTLPDKPSIAVLPFTNLSSDPEQEYFADGVAEDITMALSLFRWLFVIARNSSFTYKGRTVDVKEVGRDLGVRYVVEGSVRKTGTRIRIAGQLIDAETGAHLWANHFDGALADMFDLQDQVTASIVAAIAPRLEQEEIERVKRKPTDNLDAYGYYLRGLASFRRWTSDSNNEALRFFRKAIELDHGLTCAYGMAAWCCAVRRGYGWWMNNRAQENEEGARLARKAVHLGADDPVALCMGGYALAVIDREYDDAADFMDRGLTINPSLALGWMLSAWLRIWRGEPDLALEHVAHAMRLSPVDPFVSGMQGAVAFAHFLARRYGPASSWAEKSMRENPKFLLAVCMSAASNGLAGRLEQAQGAIAQGLQCDPGLRASKLGDLAPFRRAEDRATFAKGLRIAGLPE